MTLCDLNNGAFPLALKKNRTTRNKKINGETVLELSARRSEGVNIDWERTLWSIYDGSDAVIQKRGSAIVHAFKPQGEKTDYPVLVELYLKDGSKPFVGYKSIAIAEDTFVPVITTELVGSGKNTVFRQPKFPQKSVQKYPSGRGYFCLVFLPHERMFHAVAFPLE